MNENDYDNAMKILIECEKFTTNDLYGDTLIINFRLISWIKNKSLQ